MEVFRTMNINATGIEASRLRMETASLNIANAESSSADINTLYKPRKVKLGEAFESFQENFMQVARSKGVEATVETPTNLEPVFVHDPTHPDANADGMVMYPAVDLTDEMADMMAARRAYEAGLAAYSQSKETFLSTLEIVRG